MNSLFELDLTQVASGVVMLCGWLDKLYSMWELIGHFRCGPSAKLSAVFIAFGGFQGALDFIAGLWSDLMLANNPSDIDTPSVALLSQI